MLENDYQIWCEKIKLLPSYLSGERLDSDNIVRRITLEDGRQLLLKFISPLRPYVSRIKALGEVAYALFDWHLTTENRVTPNVYAASPGTVWRQFIPGMLGEEWRGKLYGEKWIIKNVDRIIIDHISDSYSAERIALLDFLFLCQDRSANNWLRAADGRFYAFDNNMFWPYKGRFADKRAVRTGAVGHLRPPMEALVKQDIKFQAGLFTSLHAGKRIDTQLLDVLSEFDYERYLADLGALICKPLGYPMEIIGDWRFDQVQARAEWILDKWRFPDVAEAYGKEWQALIDRPTDGKEVWKREWETENLETI